jgi:hypothetical protein
MGQGGNSLRIINTGRQLKNMNQIIKKKISMTLVLVAGMVLISSFNGWSGQGRMPFQPGEKLEYSLSWSGINAGSASLEVLPNKSLNDQPAMHFVMKANSNSFIDTFYKVRDSIDSFTDEGMNYSILYKKKQREGSHCKDITVDFDQKNNTAQYVSKKKKKQPVKIEPGTFDPLSAFYYTRCMIKDNVDIIERPVSDGKKQVTGIVRIIKKEKIEINGRKYDAYLIEPELKHVGGVFKKSNDAKLQIWISADNARIPLRIKSKVAIGSFMAELSSAEGLVENADSGEPLFSENYRPEKKITP